MIFLSLSIEKQVTMRAKKIITDYQTFQVLFNPNVIALEAVHVETKRTTPFLLPSIPDRLLELEHTKLMLKDLHALIGSFGIDAAYKLIVEDHKYLELKEFVVMWNQRFMYHASTLFFLLVLDTFFSMLKSNKVLLAKLSPQ